jgi:UDP-N-acetyl-2-amino-2-deoxyglucuronate dehydrogenase
MFPARFALIGAAGFVARRHLEAIHQLGGQVVAALDPHDSVGVLDRYALDAQYFGEEASWVSHLKGLQRQGRGVDYVVVCSPNFLHAHHADLALSLGCHVICEKPLVTTHAEFTRLSASSLRTGRAVHPVLQLRYHPSLEALRREMESVERPVEVELDYVTPRGPWYDSSWKGDTQRSGGLLLNIGVHFLDALLWIFGPCTGYSAVSSSARSVRGELLLERAHVKFRLSIDAAELPARAMRSLRRLTVLGREIRLDADLEGLHDRTYTAIASGAGLELAQALPALELCWSLAATTGPVPWARAGAAP